MLLSAFQVVLILLLPAAALAGEKYVKPLRVVPAILICYLLGILVGNCRVIPIDSALSLEICGVAVALAIPLLLFSVNIVAWFRMARSTVLSFALCIVAVFFVSLVAARLFRGAVPQAPTVAAMLVGVYTGGTPNMAAIGTALGAPPELFVKLNSADIVTAAVYLPFLFAFAQRLWGLFLPPYPRPKDTPRAVEPAPVARTPWPHVALGLVLALAVLGAAFGISQLAPKPFRDAIIILLITTIAVLLSLTARVRALRGTQPAGDYILLVFCVAVGTTAKFGDLLSSSLVILAYTAVVMFGSALVHVALAAIFRIDRDTVIITSTAAIFGPAFIGPVAVSLKNRELVVSGIATSLVGLAVGNYAGLFVAWLVA